jgi:hypothetical protein
MSSRLNRNRSYLLSDFYVVKLHTTISDNRTVFER